MLENRCMDFLTHSVYHNIQMVGHCLLCYNGNVLLEHDQLFIYCALAAHLNVIRGHV